MKSTGSKIAAALLALLIITAAIASCAEETVPTEDTTTAAAVTNAVPETAPETKLQPDLPDTVWDREFRVLGTNKDASPTYPNFEIYAEDITGDVMNDAVYTRNETVKKKYGITVAQTLVNKTHDSVTKDATAGEDNFDLVFININKAGGLAQKGYLLDLNGIDHIDFEKPWWNQKVNDTVSIHGRIYYTSSDYSLRDKNRVQVLVCNDVLREELRLDSVPALVRSNEWTAAKMTEFVTAAARDLDGDGVHTEKDCFGIGLSSYDGYAVLSFGFGLRLIGKDENGGVAIISNPDRDTAVIDAVLEILSRKDVMMTPEDYGRNWDISDDTFVDGRALFTSCSLHYVGYHSQHCDFDFTVVPAPKLNSDQENFCAMPDIECMFFAVPTTNLDPNFAGFALEAFSYESTDTTYVTFVELYCKTRNVRNADSVEMVNIILDNIIYDGAIFYSDSIQLFSILNRSIPAVNSNILLRSQNSMRSTVEKEISKINSAFGD